MISTMACVALAVPALAAAEFVPSGHDSHTILFYPLTGYENGTRWTVPAGQELTYTNKTYGASAPLLKSAINNDYAITPRLAQKGYVTVTNETPGRYLFANKNAKVPLVSDYMSIRAVTSPEVWGKYGSWFEISGFGTSFFRFQGSDAKNIDKLTLTNSIFHDMCSGYSSCVLFCDGQFVVVSFRHPVPARRAGFPVASRRDRLRTTGQYSRRLCAHLLRLSGRRSGRIRAA